MQERAQGGEIMTQWGKWLSLSLSLLLCQLPGGEWGLSSAPREPMPIHARMWALMGKAVPIASRTGPSRVSSTNMCCPDKCRSRWMGEGTGG